jgi:hypothetical protein
MTDHYCISEAQVERNGREKAAGTSAALLTSYKLTAFLIATGSAASPK